MKLSRFIEILARLLGRSRPKQKSLLLNLPLCLIYNIIDELDWAAKVIFSQTCRVMWHLLSGKCHTELRKLTAIERLAFLATLASQSPDHYLCKRCSALHLLWTGDYPTNRNRRRRCARGEILDLDGHKTNLVRPLALYSIANCHVQFAVKFSHMQSVHQEYRKNLMRDLYYSGPWGKNLQCNFAAEPRIVDDKFLLKIKFEIYKNSKELSYENVIDGEYRFPCPHHFIGSDLARRDDLLTVVRAALCQRRNCPPMSYSCNQCPSDYEVVVEDDERLLISIWKDLGSGYTEDAYWRSHVICAQSNSYFSAPELEYDHGSIKAMYSSGRGMN